MPLLAVLPDFADPGIWVIAGIIIIVVVFIGIYFKAILGTRRP